MQLTSALGHLQPKPSYHQKFFFGSVSEHNTLNTPGSGDEWEDRFFLYQKGLMSEQEWKGFIDDDIAFTLGYPFAQEFWRTSKTTFEPEFVWYVDEKLPNVDTNANYQWYLDTLKGLSTNE